MNKLLLQRSCKLCLFLFWLVTLTMGPYIVFSNSNLELILSNRAILINTIQRATGLTAFGLLTFQIFLSSNTKFIKYHMLNGILAYTFVFIHPILMIVSRYFLYRKIDPFYVYTDVCVLCDGIYEYYVNFGRIAFYLTTTAVIAVKYKNMSSWLKIHWRKLHVLNYLAFYAVSIHAYSLGSDSSTKLFIYFFWFCQIVVLYSILLKLSRLLLKPKS